MKILFRTYKSNPSVLSHLSDEDGGSLVEMAISSVLFLAILFGLIEACWALYAYNFVDEAAREATRYAIVRGNTYVTACTSPGPATCQAQAGSTGDIAQYVQGLAYPGITSSNITVTTTWPGTVVPPPCPTTVGSVCNSPGNLVQVVVSYPVSLPVPFMKTWKFTVASTSQLVISQ